MPGPRLALSIGDPAGIGPEIALKAARRLLPRMESGAFSLTLVGDHGCLAATAAQLSLPVPPRIDAVADAPLMIAPTPEPAPNAVRCGEVTAEGGRQAYLAVKEAVRMAMTGAVSGIVTGPLNKAALHLAGYPYAGHTEMLAALTGAPDSAMMLAHGAFRVSHVTTHCALEDVPKRATAARIRRVTALTADVLRKMGLDNPRIAIAALNPHCGEGGIFGRHDIDVTLPLIQRMREEGLDVVGPVPGDTVFIKLRGGAYDAVIAMYHDQGHIPVKLLGFSVDPETGDWTALSGVNLTMGLPIWRSSVDHGTAFDIAGRGIASETSMIEAIDLALQLGS